MPRLVYGPRGGRFLTFLFIVLLSGLGAGCGGSDLSFPSEYQTVFLDNGQVSFGRLAAAAPRFLTLRDVYYVPRVVSEKEKGQEPSGETG